MKKLNKKGFVLVETLVTTVFVMSIFAIMYNNFYPLIGEYEKRENYDDIDSKYAVYWLKRIIQDSTFDASKLNEVKNGTKSYISLSCTNDFFYGNSNAANRCANISKYLNVRTNDGKTALGDYQRNNLRVYITTYNTFKFKNDVKSDTKFTMVRDVSDPSKPVDRASGLADYINLMAVYNNPSANDAKYRVTAEFQHKYENDEGDDEYYYSYSTIEVIK